MRYLACSLLVLTVGVQIGEAQPAQQPAATPPAAAAPKALTTYLAVYREGPAWQKDKPPQEQLLDHGRYIFGLHQRKLLKMGGPFTDAVGGAIAFEAESDTAAKGILDADPAVISKIFVAELHPWRIVDWEAIGKRLQAAPSR